MTEEKHPLELRSEEVQEILGTPPGWLVRQGITVLTSAVAVLLAFSWFYKYPDLIRSRITVLSEHPPVTLYSKATGKLDYLLVSDQQTIEAGQLLGIVENPADYRDIYQLKELLTTISPHFDNPIWLDDIWKRNFRLGQVQPFYTAFITQLDEFLTSLRYNVYGEKIITYQRQSTDLEKYMVQLINQARILDDKMVISQRQLGRDSFLYRQGAIPETELEKSRSQFLNQEYEHRSAIALIAETRMQAAQLQRQIAESRTQRSEQQNSLLAATREKYENLKNQLQVWEQAYALVSPVAGKVTFTNIWNINQQIAEGTAVFTIVPPEGEKIIGRALVPVAGSGKVRIDQKVNIRLDNYPYLEYGILEGRITSISLVPSPGGGHYTAEVAFPGGLTTNYNIQLPFTEEMQGEAGIITSERRLIERLVAPLISIVHERMLTD